MQCRDEIHWKGLIIDVSPGISYCHTVDGRNPAPVDMENLPLFTGFYLSQVVSRISEPSTIVRRFPGIDGDVE